MKNLLLLLVLVSCGAVENSCEMGGYNDLCYGLLGEQKIDPSDYEKRLARIEASIIGLNATIEDISHEHPEQEDRYCSVHKSNAATIIDCPETQEVIEHRHGVEIVYPCDNAKEVLLKIDNLYVAYYAKGRGYLRVLEENVRYKTTDGEKCYFYIENL